MLSTIFLLVFAALTQRETGGVSSRIVSVDGAPRANVRVAVVEATSDSPALDSPMIGLTESDTSGAFRIEKLPAGRYFLVAGPIDRLTYYPGSAFPSDAKAISVVGGTMVRVSDFPFTPPGGVQSLRSTGRAGEISGVVFGTSDNPLANMTVIISSNTSGEILVTSTDHTGAFRISGVSRGGYTLKVFSPVNSGYLSQGYERLSEPISLEQNIGIEVVVKLRLAMGQSALRARPDLYAPVVKSFDGAQISISANALQLLTGEYLLDPRTASNHTGEVDIEVVFSDSGEPLSARIVDPSVDPGLARAAVEGIRNWRLPARSIGSRPWNSLRTVVALYPSIPAIH